MMPNKAIPAIEIEPGLSVHIFAPVKQHLDASMKNRFATHRFQIESRHWLAEWFAWSRTASLSRSDETPQFPLK
jgi:hypothetical protein